MGVAEFNKKFPAPAGFGKQLYTRGRSVCVAKKKKGGSLPASYGGLMRYGEAIGRIQLGPGHVVVAVAALSAVLLLLNVLG